MANDSDLIKLYSARILALAADMPRTERLSEPDGSAKRRSPLCGSTVTVDIRLNGNVIHDFGQDVKACALGQASAAIVGAHIVGLTVEQVQTGRDQLYAMLKEDGPVPGAPFGDFVVLEPARDYKNRHSSILLAFDASLEALSQAAASDCA